MIDRAELRKLARERLRDARILLKAERYDGASYLAGYVVELALKERVCRALKWTAYPQTRSEFQSYQSFKTHDLDVLLHLSGVEERLKGVCLAEWSVVSIWDPEARYDPAGTVTSGQARLMIDSARMLLRTI